MYILVSECPQFSVHINTFPKYKFCVHFRLNECMLWRLNSRKAYKKTNAIGRLAHKTNNAANKMRW